MFPPGRAVHQLHPNGIRHDNEHSRNCCRCALRRHRAGRVTATRTSGLSAASSAARDTNCSGFSLGNRCSSATLHEGTQIDGFFFGLPACHSMRREDLFRRLLRARRDWPRRHSTTDCSDKIPPSHTSPLNFRTRHGVQNVAQGGHGAEGCGFRLIVPHCACPLGVKTEVAAFQWDVCFTPVSGPRQAKASENCLRHQRARHGLRHAIPSR